MSQQKFQEDPIVGEDLFFYMEKKGDEIKLRKLAQQDVENPNLRQIYFTLCLDKGGSSREMSINLTASRNIADAARKVIAGFSMDILSPDGCKIRELEVIYGWTCSPKHSYSLHIYTDDNWIAQRLKFFCRILIGGHFAMDPLTSKVALKEHIQAIKEHITGFLYLMPEVRKEYFLNPPPPPDDTLSPMIPPPPPQAMIMKVNKGSTQSNSSLNINGNGIKGTNNIQPGRSAIIFTLDLNKQVISQNKIQEKVEKVPKPRKPYPCTICKRRFSRKCNMLSHVKTHSTERNFPCGYCSMTYKSSHHRSRHWANSHPTISPFSCGECILKFKTYKILLAHTKSAHPGKKAAKKSKSSKN